MPVSVLYEGLALARGLEVRPGELGLFLPLPAPMPVGTRLLLERGGAFQPVRVRKVDESGEPGVYIAADGELVFALVETPPSDAVPRPLSATDPTGPTQPPPAPIASALAGSLPPPPAPEAPPAPAMSSASADAAPSGRPTLLDLAVAPPIGLDPDGEDGASSSHPRVPADAPAPSDRPDPALAAVALDPAGAAPEAADPADPADPAEAADPDDDPLPDEITAVTRAPGAADSNPIARIKLARAPAAGPARDEGDGGNGAPGAPAGPGRGRKRGKRGGRR